MIVKVGKHAIQFYPYINLKSMFLHKNLFTFDITVNYEYRNYNIRLYTNSGRPDALYVIRIQEENTRKGIRHRFLGQLPLELNEIISHIIIDDQEQFYNHVYNIFYNFSDFINKKQTKHPQFTKYAGIKAKTPLREDLLLHFPEFHPHLENETLPR